MRFIYPIVYLLLFGKMAFAQTHQFVGSWITASENIEVVESPLFRKEASIKKKVIRAEAYVAGLGYYFLFVNGQSVSDAVLNQEFTKYDSRILFRKFDITNFLKIGSNCIAVELGNGWYNMQSKTIWNFDKIKWRKSPRLLFDLILYYSDGTLEKIKSDSSWKTSSGASQFNSMYAGEIYDARKEPIGWKYSGYDDGKWKQAKETFSPGGDLEEQQMPTVRVIKNISPTSFKKQTDGSLLYDMGENFAGVVQIRVKGKSGDTITMQHGERLNSDGSFDEVHNSGQMIGKPSDPKFQTDIYILSGKGTETYSPRFTYHGFRYVRIRASKGIKLSLSSLKGLFYSTDFKLAGSFRSSSVMLNRLYGAAIQSYRSNFISIPTDCPQREKMGWLADAHIVCDLGLWNFDCYSGYKKFLGDIRNVQLSDGRLPGVAPTNGIGYSWIDLADRDFGPAWGSALPIISWESYRHSGDTTVLRENFGAITLYLNGLATRARASDYLYRTGLDDFLSIEKTPKAFTSTSFLYKDAVIVSKIAVVLGNKDAEKRYRLFADSVKTAFNNEFFDYGSGSYRIKTLTALSASLENELCPEQYRGSVAAELARGVLSRNYKPDFGLLGTKYVLSALSDNGYPDQAFRLLSNPNAGWGKWISEGATTLYEGWEPKDQSLNHVFFGDFAAWYFRSLAGIEIDEAQPGFSHFSIQPVFPKGLDWIDVSHDTKYGEIKVKWKRKTNGTQLSLTIPQKTSADLAVKGYEQRLESGKQKIFIKQ